LVTAWTVHHIILGKCIVFACGIRFNVPVIMQFLNTIVPIGLSGRSPENHCQAAVSGRNKTNNGDNENELNLNGQHNVYNDK
jgi:hypothetical protein